MRLQATLVLSFSCFIYCSGQFNSKNKNVTVDELGAGICSSDKEKKIDFAGSPTGALTNSENFKILKQTDKIPLKIGSKFGVEYFLLTVSIRELQIEQVWIFPKEITNDKGDKFKEVRYPSRKTSNRASYAVYTIEKAYEMVKGKWVYQMYYEGKLIYEKAFWLQ